MTLDIRGSTKNTKPSNDPYAVFDELFSNAIDSYLIRRDSDATARQFEVAFLIEFFDSSLTDDRKSLKITCTDNGAGFGDRELKAFVTKDTSFKDDLLIPGLGRSRGSGRIQYFHLFSKLQIHSTYKVEGKFFDRRLSVDEESKEIDETSFQSEPAVKNTYQTSIVLDGFKHSFFDRLFPSKDLIRDYSADALKRHLLVTSMHRLVSIQEFLGDFRITIRTRLKAQTLGETSIDRSELPKPTDVRRITLMYRGQNLTGGTSEQLSLTHYKLNAREYDLPRNVVALCAKSSPVQNITKRYLKTATLENKPHNDFYHLVLVEGDYLDTNVNEQRDAFLIPEKTHAEDRLLAPFISFEELYDAIDPIVTEMMAPPDWDKNKIVRTATERFGISPAMISDTSVRVTYGDTDESVARRVLSVYQERAIDDTTALLDLRAEISKTAPDSEDFRDKVRELAWQYTSSLKNMDMANLSQLVVRRALIIEILGLAIRQELEVQATGEQRRKDEQIIHSIFFPMRKDSLTTDEHDIWLLSEEYQYYEYIASDKPLSALKWTDGEPLFESDIDAELEQRFAENAAANPGKRPDIAIFSKEGSAIIVEFKAPGIDLSDHVNDLMEYSKLLAAKSKGRLKKFYGYLIGTELNENRLRGYKRFPNGNGYFSTEPIEDFASGRIYGELYSEILFFNDIHRKAQMRLQVYQERLDLRLS